jgi:hypothetical protein
MRHLPRLCLFVSLLAVSAVAQVSVAISPRRAPLTLHQTQQFSATVSNTTNHAVNWKVDGITGGNASVGTISTSGLYTPPSSAGTHTISAQSKANITKSATASAWVTNYPGMMTYHADKFRSGVNSQELALTSATVKTSSFGKLFSLAVDGQIYAQPLYVSGLTIGGVRRNVVFVATEHDSVYAFDADGKTKSALWKRSFINTAGGITPKKEPANGLISPEIGITGTPVIDPASNTLYVAAMTIEHGTAVHRVHALSLTTGAEKFGGPVVVSATYKGATFSPSRHLQRASLLLLNGVVFVAYTSFGDALPYQGWFIAFTANGTGKLHQAGAFSAGPTKGAASIWMSGGGPAADNSGNIFISTANGAFDLNTGGSNAGDTVLKLTYSGGTFNISDYFTPSDQQFLDSQDLDLGSGGPFIAPTQSGAHPNLLLTGGKNGTIYVVNRSSMGKFNASHDGTVQQIDLTQPGSFNGVFSTPAGWNGWVYFGAVNDPIEAFKFSNGLLPTTADFRSSETYKYPGATPMVSAHANSNGIVWALDNSKYVGGTPSGKVNTPGPAVLHAYNANNISQELYNSAQAANGRDTGGTAVKYTVPTIANGHVYIGGGSSVTVYGVLP